MIQNLFYGMAKIAFRNDNQKEILLFPPSLEEKIPATHSVRVVNTVIDNLNVDSILDSYRGGGNSCFHPRQMLKILVYAYLNNIYSSRRIEQCLQENIYYMWLGGGITPDHRTINYFRGKRLKGCFDTLFTQIVELLHKEGFVSLQVQYIDGTKIESAANKYSFVWRGSVDKYDTRLREKTDDILRDIEQVIEEESKDTTKDIELTTEEFSSRVERIKERMQQDGMTKQQRKQIKELDSAVEKMAEYDHKKEVLGSRNSYSKSDEDATFMRMKEDAMLNGQLKPGYNVQISTENQFITNYGIYQRPTDTETLIDYLESFKERYGIKSKEVVADAGYGSEQNYNYMLENEMVPYVKYNYFHKEQKRKQRNNPYLQQNLIYDKEQDVFICPNNKTLIHTDTYTRTTELGYESKVDKYECEDCSDCPLKSECTKARGNREIEVNHTLNEYKRQVRELLTSERGLYHRSKRPIEPEAVFGQIKDAHHFRRFRLRSLPKVNIEFGLIAMAHNLQKLAKLMNLKPKNGNNSNNSNNNSANMTNESDISRTNLRLAQLCAA